MRLAGKSALITGAARGIGRAFAESYLREGARVAIGDIDFDRAQTTASELGAGAMAVRLDVTDQDSIDLAVAETVACHGQIDILINNAAVFTASPIVEITREDYDRAFDVNVSGTLFTLQAVARHMITSGIRGKIINMASQAGRRGEPLVAVYCATKAAVISYTQSSARALAPHKIRVNAISPGVIDTPMWGTVDALFARFEGKEIGQKKREVGEAVPLGYMGAPSDVARVAVFLASDQSSYITAQTINVDGGNVMS